LTKISFSSPPDLSREFKVGDIVEVKCDHENVEGTRVNDWLKGIVVQAEPKIVAVQFKENVYLTDGWMIPDQVLWYPHSSPMIRFALKKKRRPRQ
jgi:hypothetical protein